MSSKPPIVDFPLLETEHLILRNVIVEDAEALLHHFSDDAVTQFMDIESLQKIEEALAMIQFLSDTFKQGQGIRWGILLKDTYQLIGTCGYHNWDLSKYRTEVGYDLSPIYWGKGLMKEALQAVIACGFGMLNLNRIEALVDPENFRSQGLLLGLGFQKEGILRDHDFCKGRFLDDISFSLLKREWGNTIIQQ